MNECRLSRLSGVIIFRGIVELLYGRWFEVIKCSINISMQDQDARRLSEASTEQAIAEIIANVYFELDIDETDPPFVIGNLEHWNLVIQPIEEQA